MNDEPADLDPATHKRAHDLAERLRDLADDLARDLDHRHRRSVVWSRLNAVHRTIAGLLEDARALDAVDPRAAEDEVSENSAFEEKDMTLRRTSS